MQDWYSDKIEPIRGLHQIRLKFLSSTNSLFIYMDFKTIFSVAPVTTWLLRPFRQKG
jgi:hypothetical protein